MGSSASKVAGKAAGAAGRRQYPSTSSILHNTTPTPNVAASRTNATPQTTSAPAPSQVHPNPAFAPPAEDKDSQIELDGRDPQFGSALRKIGVAKPVSETRPHEDAFPTSSQPMSSGQNIFPTGTTNPAMHLVQSRERFNKLWETEEENRGRGTFAGRTLLSANDIKEALTLRDEGGRSTQQIEKEMRLSPGILDKLVAKGIIGNA
ncbi:hypothetical protein B0A52_04484 [Exophiala mesophila]|uniref:Helix-turn-helix domain-containing protein n=1 Tax=Exophiala mesophila TaxID=212818 RepID=A0A438N922_EXOME|nr:hypothetical protein B0A52_04484 [Exophiala mesophila]